MMDLASMMDPKKVIKQMVDFNKAALENSFKGIAMFQEQAEKMRGQATWIPDEGKKAFDGLVESYKSNYENFKTIMDDNFKNAEEYLAD